MGDMVGKNLRLHSLDEGVQGGQGDTCHGVVVGRLLEEALEFRLDTHGIRCLFSFRCLTSTLLVKLGSSSDRRNSRLPRVVLA
jgi:hypothetical protein